MSTPLRLVINGRFLTQPLTGVQRFAGEILRALDALIAAAPERIEAVLLAPPGARDLQLPHIPMRIVGSRKGYYWEQIELPLAIRRHGLGRHVLLSLCNLGPLAIARQLLVVHDATIRAMPAAFSPLFRMTYRVLIPALCLRVQQLATVSQFSKREIARWYGVDEARLQVCGEGSDHMDRVEADPGILAKIGLPDGRYFLGVGLGGGNKNTNLLLEAYAALNDTSLPLALTGRRDNKVHGDDRAGEQQYRTGYVSDGELKALYEHALALVYPSSYEGFGLPSVEAMRCGCPVIVSDQPALTELGGDAVLVFPRGDTSALTAAMRRLADDSQLRAGMIQRGRARAATVQWQTAASNLLDQARDVT